MSAINIEWLNENSLRAYPLKEDCSRIPVDSTGSLITDIQLPNYLIVDFVMTTSLDTAVRVYIKQVACVGNLLTLAFYDEAGVVVSLLSIDLSTHVKNTGYALVGNGIYEDVRGRIVLGDLTNLHQDLPEGLYNFTIAATEFEASTVRPDLRGVRSLQLSTQGTESQYIYGHVKLVAGANVSLVYVPSLNAIRINALSSAGLDAACDCGAIGKETVVKTINGIPVEDAVIVGDSTCVDVTTSGNTITISDKCSKPCCGCPELEFITNSLKVLEVTLTNLQAYSLQLAERIETFVTNFILTIK